MPNVSESQQAPEHVVAIGASAGGIPALKLLVEQFKNDSTSFVLLMHLSPDKRSYLSEILQESTEMKVNPVLEPTRLMANNIYVIAPGMDLEIADGVVLPVPQNATRPRWTIDRLFNCLAKERKEQSVGVVLSGCGTDGTKGLAAIRRAGGKTFVQSPQTAEFAEMPRSAQVSAQFCLSPAELGQQLMRSLGIVESQPED